MNIENITDTTLALMAPQTLPAAGRSTGPKTPEGKARSRMNALKIGLFTKVLPSYFAPADGADHDTLIAQLREDFQPETQTEITLIESMAINYLRLRRVLMMEEAIIEPGPSQIDERIPRPVLADRAVVDDVEGTTQEKVLLERFVKALGSNTHFDFTREEACSLGETLYSEITHYERVVHDRRNDIAQITEELAHLKKLKTEQPAIKIPSIQAPEPSPNESPAADLKPEEETDQPEPIPSASESSWEITPEESIRQYQDQLEMARSDVEMAKTNNLEYGRLNYRIRNREQITKCLLNHEGLHNPKKWLELARSMVSHRKLLLNNTADYQGRWHQYKAECYARYGAEQPAKLDTLIRYETHIRKCLEKDIRMLVSLGMARKGVA